MENAYQVSCPTCGATDVDICHYDSMLVVGSDLALFYLTCASCGSSFSTMHTIPMHLMEDVYAAAAAVGAGMGRS